MHPEAKLMRLAGRQYQVFSRAQALEAGLSRAMVDGKLARGLWVPLHRGVYVVAGTPIANAQRLMGAELACGPSAAASHDSAAVIWGLSEVLDVPHISVPSLVVRAHRAIIVHRRRHLEVVSRRGLRVTAPMLTLVDLAGRLTEERLERALDDAHRQGIVSIARLRQYLEAPVSRSLPGSRALRRLVALRTDDGKIGSHLETLMFRALRDSRLPAPVPQHPVRTRRGVRYLDFAYPDRLIAIELDGYTEHGTRRAFEDDRVRQNELEEMGWHVLRFTWTQVRTDAVGVAVTVGVALGLRPKRWTKPSPSAGNGRMLAVSKG